jgi:hypothetical protein
LAACGGNASTKEVLRYDLGGVAARSGSAVSRVPLAMVDVEAASWLGVPDMHFRLAYAEPLQRRSYSESRWAAPPAELLEAFLKRRIVFNRPSLVVRAVACRSRSMNWSSASMIRREAGWCWRCGPSFPPRAVRKSCRGNPS